MISPKPLTLRADLDGKSIEEGEMENLILDCGHPASPHVPYATGYGTRLDGKKICWDCCAHEDRERMIRHRKIDLYLVIKDGRRVVSNWPGTLEFPVGAYKKGRHNLARTREDVWFRGPDGFIWHGVQIGEFSQICRCKSTKKTYF